MHRLMKAPCILTYVCDIQTHAGVTAVWKQHRTGSVNSYCFQTTREVILSALFIRQLSGSQLSSRWDKNVLSFKRFCSTGAVHQFSHLHSRGDKGLAGKFVFASGYTVLLSLYQPEMKQVYKAARFKMRRSPWTDADKDRNKQGDHSWGACSLRRPFLPDPTLHSHTPKSNPILSIKKINLV